MKGKGKSESVTFRSTQASMLNGSPMYHLDLAKSKLPISDFVPLLTWAMTITKNGKFVASRLRDSLFPRNIYSLKSAPLLSSSTLARDMHWFSALLCVNFKRLNRYLELASDFEDAFMSGASSDCEMILSVIESEFGYSLWLIETRIGFLQYFQGVESQKKYVNELKVSAKYNVPWLSVNISKRNEEPTTYAHYVEQTTEDINESDELDLSTSLKYQTVGAVPEDERGLIALLYYETDSSLIDAYNAFFSVLKTCILDEAHVANSIAHKCLAQLSAKVADVKLSRLMFVSGRSDTPRQIAFPQYQGEKKDGLDSVVSPKASHYINAGTDWPRLWNSTESGESSANIKEVRGLRQDITNTLQDIFSKGGEAEGQLDDALKLCLNFRWFSFSVVLGYIIKRELSSEPLFDLRDGRECFVHSKYYDSELIDFLPYPQRDIYAQKVLVEYDHASLVKAHIWAYSLNDPTDILSLDLSEESRLLLSAEKAYRSADYPRVIESGIKLLDTADERLGRLASRLVASAYEKMYCTEELLAFVAKIAARDPAARNFLPIPECSALLTKEVCKKLAGKLFVPVVLSLNSRYYDDGMDKQLSYAYEDFLMSLGWEVPSQLSAIAGELDKSQLVYYLRYVCIPQLMKVSSEFKGSIAVQDERLAVCSMLLNLDPENSLAYEYEIKQITRAQAVRKGVRHVEQSKISIDLPALRKWAEKKLKESFFRYRAMVKAGIIPVDEFNKAYIQLLSDGKPMPAEFLKVPVDEAGALLAEMVALILTEATVNPMHGLDCYLSMRIRHGALSGQLRGPLELENIITKRQADSNSYASNEIWMSRLTDLSQPVRDQIDIGLCIFSARYDHFIENITHDFIQVRSSDKPNGLFDIYISTIDLRILATVIEADTEFSAFFESFISIFWKSVERCLLAIRQTVEDLLKPRVNDIFNTLQISIRQAAPSATTGELNRAIHTAHTNAIEALEQMKDWFKLPTPRVAPLFEVEELIDVGLQCVQRIHKDFHPALVRKIENLPPIANALTMFSDIFFIVFDNARRYASSKCNPEISINIQRDGLDFVDFSIVNEVCAAQDQQEGLARLEAIKSRISSGEYHEAVNSEGGTGLIKIKKIIGVSQFLDFGYLDESSFFVKFKLPWKEISL